ncbi:MULTISPECIES: helix-turn-helix domain-containing protein [Leptospira]|uniref:DNA-binding helix-turn-helix protein n=2 Tax=Leptospira weilii TaxID=28184 RepID=M6Q1L2_9LEPT|nr:MULTISPECIES: helix-turn-helix domain-containing protein [Leptospira]EMN89421.1 DNA-binding helix-turn-helix protein [Leptospira weilii str. UI 13098]MCL8268675.1 helix-turn-helix domain-containing protein [Leptospira weilii]MDL5247095.1 helix-turn-helix domain-containing protein [Leptospira weilii]QDK22528.1 helix-turn-helix domain-containing protein [Leptospira weilii]QDK27830.1 helix-turn-helix domain-containing protein [Leptospira weilii]
MKNIEVTNRIKIAINFLKESRGLNQNQIALKLRTTPGTVTRLLNGENSLTESMALVFEYVFGISSNWLLFEKGEMLMPPRYLENKEDTELLHKINKRMGMRNLIESLLRLSDRDLSVIQATAKKLEL